MDEYNASGTAAVGPGTRRVRRPFQAGDAWPCFPDVQKIRAKRPRPGGGRRSRWKTADGRIIERDRLHDTVEVYDPSGRRHLGEFDPWGRQTGEPTRSDALRGALTNDLPYSHL